VAGWYGQKVIPSLFARTIPPVVLLPRFSSAKHNPEPKDLKAIFLTDKKTATG
jgi:hypothetical protein